MKQIKVTDFCNEFEQKLVEHQYSELSLRSYRNVFREFMEYAAGCDYSQSKGTDFLVWKFQQFGGFVTAGEQSATQSFYFCAIRSLAEYYNFGILFRRRDFYGEIVWPKPFKEATEDFLRDRVEYGCSQKHHERCKNVIKDLILFLDSASVHDLNGITSGLISRFVQTMVGYAPGTIAGRLSVLRQYFKYAYLNEFTDKSLDIYLPHPPQRTRTKLPTVWTEEEIERLINGIDTTTVLGKRNYAMLLVGARLGLRIGDILNLKESDINWEEKLISIVQGKTREPLTTPLPLDVGWAIIDYKRKKPLTEYPNLFVNLNPPYIGFPLLSTLRKEFSKALKRAGIPIDKTKHWGWHSLRHSLATNLLQNNVDVSTISDILGHSDPNVAQHYLRVDMKGLSKCALEVEVMDYVKE
jgi:site-specific recombinase XerD